ncbi:acyl-CoA dehydrogenase family protein [Streptomyces sp. MAR4 CNX-425]|uniref:acyl-CoA dehydrogenase family protein n=1 Tax=Streptomyces sp. MAR4 CNX-425 TaxID=3406343 RepID=UPI003B512BD4
MGRLAQTEGLTELQREIVATVRGFVDKEILPVATELEHRDEYPAQIVEGLRDLGVFGLMIPEEYGGLGESLLTYALCVEEIARGWMSVSGIINTHFIVAYMIKQHGTPEQREHFLPRMAAGEVRGAFSMSEPGLGSDVAAITSRGVRDGDGGYLLTGQKMWLTNGGTSSLVAVLCRTDEGRGADAPAHRSMTTFLVEKEPGFGTVKPGLTIPGKIDKMGYKGVDTTELIMEGLHVPADRVLGGPDGAGRGFYQMMDGVEVGRVNVAARGCGVAQRAFELGVDYAQQRQTFGRPIARHQAIQFKLAEMATKVEAAHAMMVRAARKKDTGERNDLEAGMAKYLASEYCKEVVEDAFRIHGGYGFSKEYEIERLYREAPMLLIGEGTAEIQKMIIGRRLLEEYGPRG